ncbi:hypothetical protein SELMODRAFT_442025 [Selaginella moellendorffii]|uniref:glucan endo-1,3-beta-D-glucosidase n=1 Tax=Selaginella moellendorffii TaxID=88036 RepID=D8RQQ0_SELML|nr:glucan endo-1,3-beta-glucosidase 3 [Selaginella moellendorffii]EFJ25492.1 hypothetical protein SELMODRAFT_442025 [Selaginella moellendorffii]|eukprot:XP_024534059.1 glucan endo-1,3-beta-glucosidase 3 [Selaginella moellendorffii]
MIVGFLIVFLASSCSAFVGVNYGTDGDNLPTPQQVVDFLQRQQISHVRIFDTDAGLLQAFAGSNIQVLVGIPNEEILSVGKSNASAVDWVKKNVMTYLPGTNITGIVVGSQVLTDYSSAAASLVSTMRYIHAALVAANLDDQVKVSTPHGTAVIQNWFPPSAAVFNQSYAETVMRPMLDFLADSSSYFMLNFYPLAIYAQNQQTMSIDFALFRPNSGQIDSSTNLLYTNLFETVIDGVYSAMAALNFTGMPLVVSETGWPSRGDPAEVAVSLDNAATYASNFVRHILNNTGTPRRPGLAMNAYMYELFNEDMRQGATSEKNYGLFYPDQTPVYTVDLTGASLASGNGTRVPSWCIAKEGMSTSSLQAALDYACGQGRADCSQLQPGQQCYFPDTVLDHASYAFNKYYQKAMMAPGSCDFAGVATVTFTDPSHGQCRFPTIVPQQNTTSPNVTRSFGQSFKIPPSTGLLFLSVALFWS